MEEPQGKMGLENFTPLELTPGQLLPAHILGLFALYRLALCLGEPPAETKASKNLPEITMQLDNTGLLLPPESHESF